MTTLVLCLNLSAKNSKEEDQLLIRCHCFTPLNNVTRWFILSLLHGPWVALRGCFTLRQNGPGDCLPLPKPHCLAGRGRWYQPFCCPHVPGGSQELPDVSHSWHTLRAPQLCPPYQSHPAQVQHQTPAASPAGLCAVSLYLRRPLPSPTVPTRGHLQPHWLSR